jgi:hypothetical protein
MMTTTFSRGEPGTVRVSTDDGQFAMTTKEFPRYQKKVPTCAHRVEGPFVVATSEGPLSCADGYLCIDARGYPYPVAADEFDLIYAGSEAEDAPTLVSRLLAIQADIEGCRSSTIGTEAGREYSIAVTAVEDAIMRINRAFAKYAGTFTVADVEQLQFGDDA